MLFAIGDVRCWLLCVGRCSLFGVCWLLLVVLRVGVCCVLLVGCCLLLCVVCCLLCVE